MAQSLKILRPTLAHYTSEFSWRLRRGIFLFPVGWIPPRRNTAETSVLFQLTHSLFLYPAGAGINNIIRAHCFRDFSSPLLYRLSVF